MIIYILLCYAISDGHLFPSKFLVKRISRPSITCGFYYGSSSSLLTDTPSGNLLGIVGPPLVTNAVSLRALDLTL